MERHPAEIGIDARTNKGIVPGHRRFETARRHGNALVLHLYGACEFCHRVRSKEEAGGEVHIGRSGVPILPCNRVGIENGPDWTAAVMSVANAGERGVDEVVGFET